MHKIRISILLKGQDRRNRTEKSISSGYAHHASFFFKQIQLKDLLRTGNVKSTGLKANSLMELMKLKPPPDITTPVATATATGQLLCNV